ncbi:hypothetical protein ACIRBX_23910 [Kitasatospora sp. NPDC096147]|uniref:hypothetical protein n=1 Tax=Kitasatospora sp. NPDC096147 TaxID=3364093 RepID=UPI003805B58B
MTEAERNALTRMRGSADAWPETAYERATDPEGYAYDRNAVRRAQVLWALQYDRRPEDLELVRWLAGQEAVCRREAPFQGLGEEATLAGLLLAEFRRVEDVWLHWEIKRANFDTWCGYDLQALCAAGVAATLDHVRAGGHPKRDDLLARLLREDGEPWLSEEEVARWFEHARSSFPADPAEEDTFTLVERARLTGDTARARALLDTWAAGQGDPGEPYDAATLGELRYWLAELGDFAGAARAEREALALAPSAGDRTSGLLRLARLERQAGDHPASWVALTDYRLGQTAAALSTEHLPDREYVEELFRLAEVAEPGIAGAAFAEADRQVAALPSVYLALLRSAVAAATNIGDRDRAAHYAALAKLEEQRVRVHDDSPDEEQDVDGDEGEGAGERD